MHQQAQICTSLQVYGLQPNELKGTEEKVRSSYYTGTFQAEDLIKVRLTEIYAQF